MSKLTDRQRLLVMFDESRANFRVDAKAICVPCGIRGQVTFRFHDDPGGDGVYSRSSEYVEGKLCDIDWEPENEEDGFSTHHDILDDLCTILGMSRSSTMDDVYEKLRQLVAEKP